MRVAVLRTFFLLLLAVLAFNLYSAQVINGQYYLTLSEHNRIRALPVPALRGRILDLNGIPLAENRPSYDIQIVPEDFNRSKKVLLADVLNIEPERIDRVLDEGRKAPYSAALIKKDAAMEEVFQIEELKPELEGVHLEIRGKRHYVLGEAAGHLTGYIGMISRDEYEQGDRTRFLFSDYIGRSGIEASTDSDLRGYHGGKQIEVNSGGRVLRTLSERRPARGKDVYLTIDSGLQSKLFELIKDKRAVIGMLDIATDGVLALVSTPGYDPNAFVERMRTEERMEYLRSPERPMINQAVRAGFPLGSVFKLVVALGALQEGVIDAHTTFNCPGSFRLKPGTRPFQCWLSRGHGKVDLYGAIEQSCNVYFYEVGKRLGVDRIARYARTLGLGSSWDAELGRMFPGIVPDRAWKMEKVGEKWYQGETISLAIGQSYLLVSPLQVLRLVATIARDGALSEPHIVVRKVKAHPSSEKKNRTKIATEHFNTVKAAMTRAVAGRAGTAQLARVDGLSLAGKTGTAQAPHGDSHSWFAGFAPAESPKIAVVVFIAHGGSGGHNAAPLARRALEIWNADGGGS